MTSPVSVELDLLRRAEGMRSGAASRAASYWPRAAALLGRMALEATATRRLESLHVDLRSATMRSKLLLLHLVVSADVVLHAQRAWAGLSRSCHQHPYELAPNLAEITGLLEAVRVVVTAPERRGP